MYQETKLWHSHPSSSVESMKHFLSIRDNPWLSMARNWVSGRDLTGPRMVRPTSIKRLLTTGPLHWVVQSLKLTRLRCPMLICGWGAVICGIRRGEIPFFVSVSTESVRRRTQTELSSNCLILRCRPFLSRISCLALNYPVSEYAFSDSSHSNVTWRRWFPLTPYPLFYNEGKGNCWPVCFAHVVEFWVSHFWWVYLVIMFVWCRSFTFWVTSMEMRLCHCRCWLNHARLVNRKKKSLIWRSYDFPCLAVFFLVINAASRLLRV